MVPSTKINLSENLNQVYYQEMPPMKINSLENLKIYVCKFPELRIRYLAG